MLSSPIHIAIAATVVMSMGWLVTAQQAPAIPATYRATCEFSPQGEWFNTTCTTLSDHPPGGVTGCLDQTSALRQQAALCAAARARQGGDEFPEDSVDVVFADATDLVAR